MDLLDYEEQLRVVELALETEPQQQQELEDLKSSILELLKLTKPNNTIEKNGEPSTEEDEMHRFMTEINEIEKESSTKTQNNETAEDINKQLIDLRTELEKLIGQRCSAPHLHSWGATTYHNAIVSGISEDVEIGGDANLEGQLRVFFTNPTHKEMLPCQYFLEGECRFEESRCHYSHGKKVSLTELRDFNEPDFSRLARNCVVLAKINQSGLWHRGRVLCVNFVEKECRVRLDSRHIKEREGDYKFEDLLPIFHDEDLSSGSSSENSTDSEIESDDIEEARRTAFVQQSLFTFLPNQALGEWEQHTKGIGSKLMEKMGYIHGSGLGSTGQGIVIPITAQILPQGRSLDYCMQLREMANGDKDLFSVERKLQREKKKQEAQSIKAFARESERVDVFSFLNDNILSNQKQLEKNPEASYSKASKLTEKSTKLLNIESVQISDDIRRKQREIAKTEESLKRNSNSMEIYKKLEAQLKFQRAEIQDLQNKERRLETEQVCRKTKKKLSVF